MEPKQVSPERVFFDVCNVPIGPADEGVGYHNSMAGSGCLVDRLLPIDGRCKQALAPL